MALWKAQIASLAPPLLSQSVHREECTQCFDNQDSEEGIDVCLTCFNGGCLGPERHHAQTHFEKAGHPLSLNVKRRSKPRRDDSEPPLKRIAIQEEREEDQYLWTTTLRSWTEQGKLIPEASDDSKVRSLIDGVMKSMSSARQSEVKAWEEEITACEHTLTLDQSSSFPILASGLAHCSKCELTENLWLCLTCGSLGCGRQQFGGIGGNGHGLNHYEETHHPVAVKLGTITAEGTADIYCYDCNDSRLDPELAAHLASFGINIITQEKTEKTITELQIEHNLKFDFSMVGEDGKALEPVFGPNLTGLNNLGNSCYMASTLQSVFALPSFQSRYFEPNTLATHWLTCREPSSATCFECQMLKMADGLLSGRYSHPRVRPDPKILHQSTEHLGGPPPPVFQEGIKPSMFKSLIGKGHEEFSTMRQQDAEEFFTHLVKVIRQDAKKRGVNPEDDPTDIFRYGMEQRLQCGECKRVSYRVDSMDTVRVPVPVREKGKTEEGKVIYDGVKLEECFNILTGTESLEYKCPVCKKNVIANKQSRFATFPKVLVAHAQKFQLVNWVPQKLDIPLDVPKDENFTLDRYIGHGVQESEELLPTEESPAPSLLAFDAGALAMLEGMGFPLVRSQKALLATGNSSGEAAMEWLFAHMDDPDIDDPIQLSGSSVASSEPGPSPELISMIGDMGFTPAQARKALKETGNDPERAIDWLFSHPDDDGSESPSVDSAPASSGPGGSATLPANYHLKAFISHKGPSVHSGHYVATIRIGSEWVLFNDEKVVKSDEEAVDSLRPYAYLYIFERV